jgi:hypothetical protein
MSSLSEETTGLFRKFFNSKGAKVAQVDLGLCGTGVRVANPFAMRFQALLSIFFLTFLLAACSKTESARDQSKIEEGNRKTARMVEIRRELARSDIYLSTQSHANADKVVEKMKPVIEAAEVEKLEQLKILTEEFARLGMDVLKLINDKDVTYAGNREELISWIKAAKGISREISAEIERKSGAEAA